MKKWLLILISSIHFISCGTSDPEPELIVPVEDIWVTAYLASWNYQENSSEKGKLPLDEIDWRAFTHLNFFTLTVDSAGTLVPIRFVQSMAQAKQQIDQVVGRAHREGIPVLLTIGGEGSHKDFSQAVKPENRSSIIANLVDLLKTHRADGIDLDMEPIYNETVPDFEAFVNELYDTLQSIQTPLLPKPLLTVATVWQPEMFGRLSVKFDQINLMTYNLSGAFDGWVSWHNAPVYSGGNTFPDRSIPLPSANGLVEWFLSQGVSRHKLGIGIYFYGYIWEGEVYAPLQSWEMTPEVRADVPYYTIMQKYHDPAFYRWDAEAQAAYLSIDTTDTQEKIFISYDEEMAIQAKIDYIKQKGIGGVIIWELGGGYRYDQPPDERDGLLQAVKKAALSY